MKILSKFALVTSDGVVTFPLYNKFKVSVPKEDWEFMCNKRWASNTPSMDIVEAEFGLCGARSAKDNNEAQQIVTNTIAAFRRILSNDDSNLYNSTFNTVAKMDSNGAIYFEEVLD